MAAQAAAAVLLLLHTTMALENGLALTPPMGWVRVHLLANSFRQQPHVPA